MADNRRDVELRVGVTTSGDGAVRTLAEQVRALAKEGGDAAPEFNRLANELDRLGDQTEALTIFTELRTEVDALAAVQAESAARANDLASELRVLAAATETFRDAENRARLELREAQRVLSEKGIALAELKLEYDQAGKKTAEYQARQRALQREILDARSAIAEKRDAVRESAAATKEAESAERALAREVKAANAEAAKSERAYTARNRALQQAGASLQQLGVDTADVAAAQAELLQSFDRTTKEVDSQQAAVVELRRAQEEQAEAARAAMAEEDRLLRIQEATKNRAIVAAQEQLEMERRQYQESMQLVQRLTNERVAAEERLNRIRDTAARSAQALDDAFAKTGVRSAQAVQREILEIDQALVKIAQNSKVSAADFERAFASAQRRIESLRNSMEGANDPIKKTGEGVNMVTRAFGPLIAAYSGIELVSKFAGATRELQMLQRALAITTGSTEEAARQIQFLRDTANNAGISVGEITNSYLRFSAAASQAGVETKVVQDVFKAITRASGQMGLGSQRAALALEAVGQMASKGVVSMEEMRQQLGDQLPGALQVAAQGVGITTAELIRLIETGQMLSHDMLPALAEAVTKTMAKGTQDVKGFDASWNRLKNSIKEATQDLADSGLADASAAVMDGLALGVNQLREAGSGLKKVFKELTDGSLQGAINALNEMERATQRNTKRLHESFAVSSEVQRLTDAVASLTAAEQIGLATKEQVAEATERLSAAQERLRKTTVDAADAADDNAEAQEKAGDAVETAGEQAKTAGMNWSQAIVHYDKLLKIAQQEASASKKLVDAKKVEGETAVRLAELSGNEIAVRAAAVQAAELEREAVEQLAVRHMHEHELLVQKRDALLAAARASTQAGGEIRKDQQEQIDKLNQLIMVKEAEVERTNQQVRSAQQEVRERRIVAQTYGDQSGALATLKAEVEKTAAVYASLRAMQALGMMTDEKVTEALRYLTQAQGRYKDALDDTAKAADRKIRAMRGEASLTQQALGIQLERARAEEMEAEATGRSRQAIEAKIDQKEIEIKMVRANIAALQAEARATIAQAHAEREAAAASGALTPEKEAEIEARLRNAEAKQLEAQAGEAVVRQLNAEIDAIRNRNAEAAQSQPATTADDQVIGRAGGSGLTTYSTAGGGMGITALAELRRKQASGSLTAEDLRLAEAALKAAKANEHLFKSAAPGAIALGGSASAEKQTLEAERILSQVQALASAPERRRLEEERRREMEAYDAQMRQGDSETRSGPQSPSTASARTVNVNIGGRRTSIAVASDEDSNNLVGMLRDLESNAGRSTL